MYERVYVCMQVRVIEMGWDINCMEWELLLLQACGLHNHIQTPRYNHARGKDTCFIQYHTLGN